MKLTIFGATGRTGRYLVEQALAAGHEVTAFARTLSKLSVQNEHLHIVQGDIQDAARVTEAVRGADAVLSVLGPSSNKPTLEVSQGMDNILAAMKANGVRRLVISAGAGVPDPKDEPKLLNHLISFLLKLVSPNVLKDMTAVVDKVRASNLDWTIVRVPMLTDDPATGKIMAGYVGKGTGPRLGRSDMASFILKQADDQTYLRQAPAISN